MKWPISWYVEERCAAPSAAWAAKVASLGEIAKNVYWSRGVLAGPPWYRELVGDTRPPLFKEAPDDDA